MNKIIALAAAFSLVLPASAQAPAASDSTAFALAFHRRLAGAGNIMTSPYSLRQALGMAYAGAAGKTRDEMALALSAGPAFVAEETTVRRGLASANGPATLKVGNALFVKEGYELLPSFLRAVKSAFDAEVFVRKFGPAAVVEINKWASAATNGRIPAILDKLEPDDRLVLLNAVYFKGSWVTAFPKKDAIDETFAPTGGKPFATKLMSVHKKFGYVEEAGWKAVRLPYKGDRLAMIAVLPDEGAAIAAFREKLDAPMWRGLRARLASRSGHVAIPKFKFEQTHDMIAPMRKLGMKLAFAPAGADFSNLSKPEDAAEELYLSKIVQKTFVAVDEEGTEAAAVTAIVGAARGSAMRREEPFRFVANRPFLFVIEEIESGTILFIGEVHDPRK